MQAGKEQLLDLHPQECSLPGDVCTKPNEIKFLRAFLKQNGENVEDTDENVINQLKIYLKVDKESEIWDNSKIKNFIGFSKAMSILEKNFKPKGPCNSTSWLSNFDTDNTLKQWQEIATKYYNKRFLALNYQTIDFQDIGGELEYLNIPDIAENYDCFATIINTDTHRGSGKHWFCIYGDLAHKGTKEDPYIIEYFNSSGNQPMEEINKWIEELKFKMANQHGKFIDFKLSSREQLQFSKSECGIWSLMYIRSRLEGKPPNWLYKIGANDTDMINIRNFLFRGCEENQVNIPIVV